jgi:membrane protease YdiL (CAAX protease family)
VGKTWANTATWITGGVAAWGIAASGAVDMGLAFAQGGVTQSRFAIDAGEIVSGVAAAGFLFRPIRKDVAAYLPIDPENPVHALALVLAVVLFGTQATTLFFTDVLALYGAQPPQTLADTFLDELPLLLLALAGVGLFVRRQWPEAAVRLGLVRPAWWQICLALGASGVFLVALQGFDAANHWLLPDLAGRVEATDEHLFAQLARSDWLGVAVLGVLPGVCEDLLFRGALQPRIGLVPTALLFTSIHSQYGLSLDLAGVLVIALSLGLIRKYTNTTTSISAHIAYNLLAAISLAGTVLYAAAGLEVVFLAAAAYGIWRVRRESRLAAR